MTKVGYQQNNSLTLLAAASLWLTFPLVSVTTKCLLTAKECTRWGLLQEGADYGFPLTAAALHLLMVGSVLFVVKQAVQATYSRRRSTAGTELIQQQQAALGHPNMEEPSSMQSSSVPLPVLYISVGVAVGTKYVVGHWALQVTPVGIFELFHCLNILSIAFLAHILLKERLTKWQGVCCIGIVIGSFLTVQSHDSSGNASMLSTPALILNLLNSLLAGAVVVVLRLSLLHSDIRGVLHGVLEVTAYKMLLGGVVACIAALVLEDATFMTPKQLALLTISSLVILVYHLTLGFLCSMAIASTVGIVEAMRPVPALLMVALIRGPAVQHKDLGFWVGSVVIILSAIAFKLNKKCSQQEEGRELLPMLHTKLMDQSDRTDTTLELDQSDTSLDLDRSEWDSSLSHSETTYLLVDPPSSI